MKRGGREEGRKIAWNEKKGRGRVEGVYRPKLGQDERDRDRRDWYFR